jgi:hypothetical protein
MGQAKRRKQIENADFLDLHNFNADLFNERVTYPEYANLIETEKYPGQYFVCPKQHIDNAAYLSLGYSSFRTYHSIFLVIGEPEENADKEVTYHSNTIFEAYKLFEFCKEILAKYWAENHTLETKRKLKQVSNLMWHGLSKEFGVGRVNRIEPCTRENSYVARIKRPFNHYVVEAYPNRAVTVNGNIKGFNCYLQAAFFADCLNSNYSKDSLTEKEFGEIKSLFAASWSSYNDRNH